VALTRCREKMIIVTSLSKENNGYNYLVPYLKRIKYRSFLDILNSLSVIDKYIVNKSANYTHDYLKIKFKDINQCNSTKIIDNRRINLNYELLENKHFSKVQNKLITSEESRKMEYGTKIHEIFEYSDFFNPDNEYVKKLVNLLPNNFINVYHEYEFSYQEDDKKYFGVIDLIIEYESELYIIDYKLKNIDDSEYQKQLSGYKKYVESISDKLVKTYLYSIIDNELREVK
jgi:ATP-dependent exoDNAse (exonuclease V) beta subunit